MIRDGHNASARCVGVGLTGVVPVAAGVPVEPTGVIVPLSDGSAAVIDTNAPVMEP